MPLNNNDGWSVISADDFWGATSSSPTGAVKPIRSAEDVMAGRPYAEGSLPEGTQVTTEEDLSNSLGADNSFMGIAGRAFNAYTTPLRALSNKVSDLTGLSQPAPQGAFSEALSQWGGVGHKDPTTGEITGQAQWAPGHSDLGTKLEGAAFGNDSASFDQSLNVLPGGIAYNQLPEELKSLPRAVLEPIMRLGAQFAGGMLEDPSALLGMGGAAALRQGARSTGTRAAYAASEIGQKAVGGGFIGKGVADSGREAKQKFEQGDIEGAIRAGAKAVAHLALGGMLVKGGIDDAKFAKGLPEDVAAQTAAKPSAAEPLGPTQPKGPTASSMGQYPDPSSLAPPPKVAGPLDYPDPSEYTSTPPVRPPGRPSAGAAPPPSPAGPTYQGQPVTVVGKGQGGRITIQTADGTKKRVAASQVQGLSRPAAAEAITPPPGTGRPNPAQGRSAELEELGRKNAAENPVTDAPNQAAVDQKAVDDLAALQKELDDEVDIEVEDDLVKPSKGGEKALTVQETLDHVWETVTKGRAKANTKGRTFGGIFSPRETEVAGAGRTATEAPTIKLRDSKDTWLTYNPEENVVYMGKDFVQQLANLPAAERNATLVHGLTHEITHKLRPSGGAFMPDLSKPKDVAARAAADLPPETRGYGRTNPAGGHYRGGVTDTMTQDLEGIRTQSKLERLVRGRMSKGGVPLGKSRIAHNSAYSGEVQGLAKDLYGEGVLPKADDAFPESRMNKRPSTVSKKGTTVPNEEDTMPLGPKDYKRLSPETLKDIVESNFDSLRKSGVPTGQAIRMIRDQVKAENGGKLTGNALKALKDLLGREKGLSAGKPVDLAEAQKILDGAMAPKVGNWDVRDAIRDIARIPNPQNLPPADYARYKVVIERIRARVAKQKSVALAHGISTPEIREADDLLGNIPKSKGGRPAGPPPSEADTRLKEALKPPPGRPAAKPGPTVTAAEPSPRAQRLNPRETHTNPRAVGATAPATTAGLVHDLPSLNRRWNELRQQPMSAERLASQKELATLARQRATELREKLDVSERTQGTGDLKLQTRVRNTITQLEDVATAIESSVKKVENPIRGRGRNQTIEQKGAGIITPPPGKKADATTNKPAATEEPLPEGHQDFDLEEDAMNISPKQREELAKIADGNYSPELKARATQALMEGTPQPAGSPKLRRFKGTTTTTYPQGPTPSGAPLAPERVQVLRAPRNENARSFRKAAAREKLTSIAARRQRQQVTKQKPPRQLPPGTVGNRPPLSFPEAREGFVTKGAPQKLEAEGRLADTSTAQLVIDDAAEARRVAAPTQPETTHSRLLREKMTPKPEAPARAKVVKGQGKRAIQSVKKAYPTLAPPPTDAERAPYRARPTESITAPPTGKKQLTDPEGKTVETDRRATPYSPEVRDMVTRNFYRKAGQSARAAGNALRAATAVKDVSPEAIAQRLEQAGVSRGDRALILADVRAGKPMADILDQLTTKEEWAKKRFAAGKGTFPALGATEGRPLPRGSASSITYVDYAKKAKIPQLDMEKPVTALNAEGKPDGEVDPTTGILTRADGTKVDLINRKVVKPDGTSTSYGQSVTPGVFQSAMRHGGSTRGFVIKDETGRVVRFELPGEGGKPIHAAGGILVDPETKQLVERKEGGGTSEPKIRPSGNIGRKSPAKLMREAGDDPDRSYATAFDELPEAIKKAEAKRGTGEEFSTERETEELMDATHEPRTFSEEAQRRREAVEMAGGAPSSFKGTAIHGEEVMRNATRGYNQNIPVKRSARPHTGGAAAMQGVLDESGKRAVVEFQTRDIRGTDTTRSKPVYTASEEPLEYVSSMTEEEMIAARKRGGESRASIDAAVKARRAADAKKSLAPRVGRKPGQYEIDVDRPFKGVSLALAARDTQGKVLRPYLRSNPNKQVSVKMLAQAGSAGRLTKLEYDKVVKELAERKIAANELKADQKNSFIQAADEAWLKYNKRTSPKDVTGPRSGETQQQWLDRRLKEEARGSEKIEPPPGTESGSGPKVEEDEANIVDEEDTLPMPAKKPSSQSQTQSTPKTQLNLFSTVPKGTPQPPKLNLGQQVYDQAGKTLMAVAQESNAMRAIASSGDFSAPFRQAVIYTMAHPVKATKRARQMIHAWTETNHKALDKAMRADPDFAEAMEAGANFVHEAGGNEAFHGSPLVQKQLERLGPVGRTLKGVVAGSERSYTYYQNAALLDMYKTGKQYLKEVGDWNETSAKELSKFSNDAVSRTKIPLGKGAQEVLTGVFFSPQMQASRARILSDPFGLRYKTKASGFARKELARAVAMGTLLMSSAYNAADAAGYEASIESDPRSSDFGKVRVGNATVDVWGGYQQMVRAGAQFLSGEYKSVSSGRVSKRDRLDTLVQFIRSKLAPAPSLGLTLATGKDMIGREAASPAGVGRAFANSASPMALRDLYDLYDENPVLAAAAAFPLALGMNINAGMGRKGSYVDSPGIKEQDQRVGDEIRRLKLMPPSLSRRVSLPGKNKIGQKYYTNLSGKEWEDFEKQAMPEVLEILDKYITSDNYKKMTKDQQTRALAARIRWVNRYKGANVQRRKDAIERFRAGTLKPSNEWWKEDEE